MPLAAQESRLRDLYSQILRVLCNQDYPGTTTGLLLSQNLARQAGRERRHTRAAYARAVAQFCALREGHGVRFDQLQPMIVAASIDGHPAAAPTVKQHLAPIRVLVMTWS